MMNDADLIFYDIECFKWDSLVVMKDINKNTIGSFWYDTTRRDAEIKGVPFMEYDTGFEKIPALIKGKVLVGYNNYNYDDPMLMSMLNGTVSQTRLFLTNNAIITGQAPKSVIDFKSLDTMQQIDVGHPSLKQIEGNMGLLIKETDVSFDIDRTLTDEERKLTEFYCSCDVEATIEIYKLRKKSYFEVKESLIKMLPESKQENAIRWNTTTISAQILTDGKNSAVWNHHKIPDHLWSEEYRNRSGIDSSVWKMWEEAVSSPEATLGKGKSVKQKTPFGTFVFGLGGIHGAPDKPLRRKKAKHKDVKSMYPSSIVHLGALEKTDIYDQMRQDRIKIKHSDPIRAGALKIVLNSVYGNFKNQYSTLYNPLASSTVCIYGQIALFDLCKRLYEHGNYEIINANTDGVVYCETSVSNGNDEEICTAWEKDFPCYELETDYFKEWIQKDVNNYIAVEDNGQITVKGGEVNKYKTDKLFANNNIRIVQIAMVEYLLNPKKDIVQILLEHTDDPKLWQWILKAGGTFAGVQDKNGHYRQKVNRIFAASDEKHRNLPATKLYKVKVNNNTESQINFPDTPEEMIVWNDAVDDFPDFERNVSLSFYYGLVKKKLKGWPINVY